MKVNITIHWLISCHYSSDFWGVWKFCSGAYFFFFFFVASFSVKLPSAKDLSVKGDLIEEGERDNDGQSRAKYVDPSSGDRMETLCWLLCCSHGEGEVSHPTPADGSRVSPSLPPFCYFNFTGPLGEKFLKTILSARNPAPSDKMPFETRAAGFCCSGNGNSAPFSIRNPSERLVCEERMKSVTLTDTLTPQKKVKKLQNMPSTWKIQVFWGSHLRFCGIFTGSGQSGIFEPHQSRLSEYCHNTIITL